VKPFHLICVLICSFLYLPFQSSAAIKGVLDFVTLQPNGTARFSGWACDSGVNVSIPVHIYLNGAAGVGQGYTSINANVSSESAVSTACSTSGTPHRFVFDMPAADVTVHQGKTVFMHGISTSNANLLINNSGAFTIPAPPAPAFVAAPSNFNAAISGATVITSWNAISGGSAYFIRQNINGVWQAEINKGTTRTHNFSVAANNIYSYQVRGCNASAQCSAWTPALTINTSAAVTYIHTDILGSVIGESNQNGDMLKKTEYKPYGERKEQ